VMLKHVLLDQFVGCYVFIFEMNMLTYLERDCLSVAGVKAIGRGLSVCSHGVNSLHTFLLFILMSILQLQRLTRCMHFFVGISFFLALLCTMG